MGLSCQPTAPGAAARAAHTECCERGAYAGGQVLRVSVNG